MAISVMRRRNVSAPDWLWRAMNEAVAAEGKSVSAVLRELMIRYVRQVERDKLPQFMAERDNPKSPPKQRPRIGAYEAEDVKPAKRKRRR